MKLAWLGKNFSPVVASLLVCLCAQAETSIQENRSWCYKESKQHCIAAAQQEVAKNKFVSARILFEKACALGEEAGCMGVATLDQKEGRKKKAQEQFQKSCAKHMPEACLKLAQMEFDAGKKSAGMDILTRECNNNAMREACEAIDRLRRQEVQGR